MFVPTFLSALPALGPRIAFTARIYYPPGVERVSLHQVYVSRLDGTHRRQVSNGKLECDGVRWIGEHELSWIEFVPTTTDSVGSHEDHSKPAKLVLYDLDTHRKRVLGTGDWKTTVFPPAWFSSATWTRGEGLYTKGDQSYRLTTGGLTRFRMPGDAFQDNSDPGVAATWHLPGQDAIHLMTVGDPSKTGAPQGDESGKATFERDGTTHVFPIDGRVVRLMGEPGKPDITWALAGWYAGSAGSAESIYKMDWKTDTAWPLVTNLLDIDYLPGDRYYAGATTNKDVRKLGKIGVWARDIVVGDTETGKHWIVCGGPQHVVHGTSVSIEP